VSSEYENMAQNVDKRGTILPTSRSAMGRPLDSISSKKLLDLKEGHKTFNNRSGGTNFNIPLA
jgi:hypothetical protein